MGIFERRLKTDRSKGQRKLWKDVMVFTNNLSFVESSPIIIACTIASMTNSKARSNGREIRLDYTITTHGRRNTRPVKWTRGRHMMMYGMLRRMNSLVWAICQAIFVCIGQSRSYNGPAQIPNPVVL